MSVAIRTAVRLQDQDDVNVTLGVGVDEYALCWDNDTAKFVLRAMAATGGLLATGATVGATAQAQIFTSGVQVGNAYTAGVLKVNNTDAPKAYNLSNGSWWSTPIPYFQSADTGGIVLDLIAKGGAADIWVDLVSNDIIADLANYETLKIYKGAAGGAYISTTAAGSGTVRNLALQTTGGKLSVGTTNAGSSFNVSGSAVIGATYTATAAPANGLIVQGQTCINTAAAGGQLTVEVVAGSQTALLLRSATLATNNNPRLDFGLNNAGATIVTSRIMQQYDNANDVGMSFHTYNSSGLAERMRINKDGKLGIGTTAPATRLDIDAGAMTMAEMTAPTGVANKAMLYTKDNGSGKTQLCCKLGDNVEIVLATQA